MKKVTDIIVLICAIITLVGFTLNNRNYVDAQVKDHRKEVSKQIEDHSKVPHGVSAWRVDVEQLCDNQQALMKFLAVQYGTDAPDLKCGTRK